MPKVMKIIQNPKSPKSAKRAPVKRWTREERIKYNRQMAALMTGYGDIWLVREGNDAVVKIEYGNYVIEVIREPLDGNFSHCITSIGIEEELTRAGILPHALLR